MKKTIYSQAYKELVKKLTKAREAANLTQKQAGKKFGRSQSYISKIEAGQLCIDVIQLKELAAIYKKKVQDFI